MGLGALQPGHLIVVLVIVLLIFGPGKLPELGKAVGEGLKELKKATSGEADANATPGSTTHAASTTAGASTAAAPAVAPAPMPAPAPSVATAPCPKCNAAVPVGDKFCSACGSAMEATAR